MSSLRALLISLLLSTVATSAASEDPLLPGETVRATLTSGEVATYKLEIETGEYIQIVLKDPGLHLQIRLERPDGRLLREVAGNSLGWTELSHICHEQGRHRLAISNHAPASVSFEALFRQKRPAEKEDRLRLEAEMSLEAATLLRDQWRKEASLAAVKKASAAAALYDSLGDRLELLWAYRWLADLYYRLAEDERALEQLQKAIEISAILDRPGTAAELEAFRGLILVRSSLEGAALEAREACEMALDWGRRHQCPSAQAMARNCLGEVDYYSGNINGALENYLRAYEIWKDRPPNREAAETALYLAGGYRDVGRMEEAETLFLEAERLWRIIGDPRGEALTKLGRGLLAARTGEYQRAIQHLSGAQPTIAASGDRLWRGVNDALLGFVYFQLGEPSIALRHFRQAQQEYEAVHALKPLSEVNLEIGRAYRVLGQHDESLTYFESSRKAALGIGDRRVAAVALLQKALTLEALGRLDEAEDSFRTALPDLEAREFRSGRAQILNGLGRIRRIRSDLLEAERLHREALALTRSADDGYQESQSLYYLALVEQSRGGLASARSFVEAAIRKVEDLRANVDDLGLRATYFSTVQDYFGLEIDLLMQLDAGDREAGWVVKAVETAERARARSLLESLVERQVGDIHPLVAEPVALGQIQAELHQAVILEYALGRKRSFLWVVSASGLSSFELPGENEISEDVRRLYEALTVRARVDPAREDQLEADQFAEQLLTRLAKILLPPEEQIAGRRLLIVPDGALHYLPFPALLRSVTTPDGETQLRPLVLDHELSRLSSASALSLLRRRQARRTLPKRGSIAILADPVFEKDDPRLGLQAMPSQTPNPSDKPRDLIRTLRDFRFHDRIPRLVSSGLEAEEILELAPAGTGFVASGVDATRSLALSGRLAQYRIVHFATHGLINPEHPALSGLVLSLLNAKGEPQDGFLRLDDIYRLHLPVDLVVLSACDTGLGREVRGEGMMGMVRGFLHAGAQNVLASLWKVDDWATEILMKEFYKARFKHGLSPQAALRQAQTRMAMKPRWKAPFNWAAFFLEGDPSTGDGLVSSVDR